MTRESLLELRQEVCKAIEQRKRLGGFDANSEHMFLLLNGMLALIENALKKPVKK